MPVLRYVCFAALWIAAAVAAAATPPIDNAALSNDADGRNWAAYGRTFGETHYSPLAEINRETVPRLNLAWTLDLDVTNNLSTPLAVDGVIYVASGYSFVHAVDARTGKLLWRYDPEVAKVAGNKLRTGWGIRGLAFWKGRLFVGTHDGRLIALDAKTGTSVWSVQTIDSADGSFVSGPPRVFNDKVVIGFGGGDFGAGARLRHGLRHQYGQTVVALVHGARRSGQGFRKPRDGSGREDLDRGVVEIRRRRNGLERHDVRPGVQPALHRDGQWRPLELEDPQPGRRRQPVPVFGGRA